MGAISNLLGKTAAAPITAIGNALDGLFTSDDERLDKAALMERLKQQPALAQLAVNAAEASHRTVFVAGWRPFIGWVCGIALAYNYVARDLLAWYMLAFTTSTAIPPALSLGELMPVLLGMLGLGAYRTAEKIRGAAR